MTGRHIYVQGTFSVVERVTAQGAPTWWEPKGTKRHAISRNFTIKDTNQIMDQLIQGNLTQYIQDEQLTLDHCVEIVRTLGLQMLDQMLVVDD